MKNKVIKIIASLFFMIIILVTGCGKRNEENKTNTTIPAETITISGSTSVGPLIEKEAEKFRQENTGTNVKINQIGSSAGIKDAINGTVEIGMSSRDLN